MAISGPIQEVIGSIAVAAASYTIALAQAPAIGSSLILCAENPGTAIISVSGGGVTWANAISLSGTGVRIEIWFGHNSDGTGGNITINYPVKGPSTGSGNVTEWRGLNNAAPDATNSNSALADATPNTGSAASAFANSLLIATGVWSPDDYSSGPTNGFSRRTSFNDSIEFAEAASRIVSSTGTYSTGWSLTAGVNWAAAIAIFGAPASSSTHSLSTMGIGR